MNTPAYDDLTTHFTRLHHYAHLGSIVSWDRAANMPPKGNDAHASAMAELAALMHRLRTEPALGERIATFRSVDLQSLGDSVREHRAVGIIEKLQDRLAARNRIGVTRGFAGCMRILGGSAVMGGFARSRFRGSCRSETVGQPGRRLGVFARGLAGACS